VPDRCGQEIFFPRFAALQQPPDLNAIMNIKIRKTLLAGVAGFTAACAFAQDAVADRAGRWEFYLLGQYWTAEDSTVEDVTLPKIPLGILQPATADVNFSMDDTFMYGFGFAYNFSDRLNTRFEFAFGEPDFDLSWNGRHARGQSFVHTGKASLEYNLLKRPLTPFIGAGLGYFYIDTGIPSGPPEYWVWWDYWWGPVVTVSQPTVTEWYLTYNASIGLRWDINDRSVLRGAVTGNWVDVDHAGGTTQTIEFTLGYSWKW